MEEHVSLGDLLKAHEKMDDLRFSGLKDDIRDLKGYLKAAVLGVFGTVGLALLNLVMHR